MATDLLDRVHGEITSRLAELKGAVDEHARLTAAAEALGIDVSNGASAKLRRRPGRPPGKRAASSAGAPTRAAASSKVGRPKASSGRRKGGKRAPRGANREAVLKALAGGEKSPAEIKTETKIDQSVLYQLLTKLTKNGELEKHDSKYRLKQTASASS